MWYCIMCGFSWVLGWHSFSYYFYFSDVINFIVFFKRSGLFIIWWIFFNLSYWLFLKSSVLVGSIFYISPFIETIFILENIIIFLFILSYCCVLSMCFIFTYDITAWYHMFVHKFNIHHLLPLWYCGYPQSMHIIHCY